MRKDEAGVCRYCLLYTSESVAAPQIGGIVRMSKFVLSGTLFFEGIGAVLLAFYFVPRLGLGKGIYYAVFHSISAFCNAGIDLMGYYSPSSSLITAGDSYLVSLTIAGLIIIGGIGFLVWEEDVYKRQIPYPLFPVTVKKQPAH